MKGIFISFSLLLLVIAAKSYSTPDVTYNLPFTITVQPNTILPSQVALGSTVHAKYLITNHNRITAFGASIVSLPPHTTIDPSGCGAQSTFTLHPSESCTLTLIINPNGLLVDQTISGATAPNVLMACWNDGISCAGVSSTADLLNVRVIPPPPRFLINR